MADPAGVMVRLGMELLKACRHGTWQSVSGTLLRGASLCWYDGDQNTCLHHATAGNNLEVIQKLYQVDKDAYLVCLLTRSEPEGNTPLLMACALGHKQLVDLFLKQSSQVRTVSNESGQTPLHVASAYNRLDVVSLLLQRQVCPIDAADRRQNTPLHTAIAHGHINIALILIDNGADLRCKNGIGANALFQSVRREQWQITKRIVQEPGPDINGGTRVNVTALHLASCKRDPQVVELLLALGANPNTAATRSGLTPLHSASIHGSLPILRSLVDAGADMTAITNTGDTPLCLAAMSGNVEVVEYFLKQGAKVHEGTARDPISLANLHGQSEIACMLMGHVFKRYLKGNYSVIGVRDRETWSVK